MTNLTSPGAAQPAMGFSNAMPDIIDSLKRLERIGSENSKTIEKIIEAARDVEQKISAQYEQSESATIDPATILLRMARDKKCSVVEVADVAGVEPNVLYGMRYTIERRPNLGRCMFHGGSEFGVSANREAALSFAKDLASGLLFLIENDLLQRQAEERDALDALQRAANRPSKREDADEF